MARVALIADTHLPGRGRTLPPACLARIAGADLLVHAGDLADMATLEMLRALGPPLLAVHGNADAPPVRAALPATTEVELDGVRLGVVHNGGPETGRLRRLLARFPGCRVVVFGHSHVPLLAGDPASGLILNPGSATDRRRQPRHSMAELAWEAGGPVEVRFWAVDDRAGPLPDALVRRAT